MVAAAPRIRRILKICEPIILPIAMSELPLRAAEMEVTNSGKLVLKATMVRLIKRSLMPKKRAISSVPSTTQSAPIFKATMPSKIQRSDCTVDIFFSSSHKGIT